MPFPAVPMKGAVALKASLSVAEHLRGVADRTRRVLVVDDLEANGRLMERLLSRDGYRLRIARDGQEALEAVAAEQPDVILMDVLMPKLDGFEACRRIKDDPATRLIPVVLVTALADTNSRIRGLEVGADDFISKPFSEPELRARVRSLLRIKHYTDELDSAESVILSLALTIEARDGTTDGHCQRLAGYAAALGAALGLDAQEVAALRLGGFLHDIGKVGIPDRVLLKPDPLTSEEYEPMKQHTIIGDRLCGELRSLRRVRPIVRHHHERMDGSGYPDGLRGDAVPLLAQIMGVVDVFDALTTPRPYKEALPFDRAHQMLLEEAARGWRSQELVEVFIRLNASP
ncbi:MAG: response regulator [Acidimicrobiia bacterium]|nr:response regulator [Acidimicrobiia bacterium]